MDWSKVDWLLVPLHLGGAWLTALIIVLLDTWSGPKDLRRKLYGVLGLSLIVGGGVYAVFLFDTGFVGKFNTLGGLSVIMGGGGIATALLYLKEKE